MIHLHQLIIILKARQLGLTWLVLAYALWLILFHPAATVSLFSLRDNEAVHLLSDERMRGMYARLPLWMHEEQIKTDAHIWTLGTGSTVKAFPTSAGDSYTVSLAIVDEADLVPDLNKLLQRVKPTIDGGGKLILLSRADKSHPTSEFKSIYKAAKQGENAWHSIFLPWHARVDRTPEWYERQRRDSLANTTSLDNLYESYPATDAEALAPRSLDKRIPADWLNQCYVEQRPLDSKTLPSGTPAIPGLVIYRLPERGRRYVIGGDPAEGNPTSDDSAATVLDRDTGEEVAVFWGKLEPSTFAGHIDALGIFYNNADLLIERNNHGHAVIGWLRGNSKLFRLAGFDFKEGWLSSERGKTLLYDRCASVYKSEDAILHSFIGFTQLSSIEGNTLRAPSGERDDIADSNALAHSARFIKPPSEPQKPRLPPTSGYALGS